MSWEDRFKKAKEIDFTLSNMEFSYKEVLWNVPMISEADNRCPVCKYAREPLQEGFAPCFGHSQRRDGEIVKVKVLRCSSCGNSYATPISLKNSAGGKRTRKRFDTIEKFVGLTPKTLWEKSHALPNVRFAEEKFLFRDSEFSTKTEGSKIICEGGVAFSAYKQTLLNPERKRYLISNDRFQNIEDFETYDAWVRKVYWKAIIYFVNFCDNKEASTVGIETAWRNLLESVGMKNPDNDQTAELSDLRSIFSMLIEKRQRFLSLRDFKYRLEGYLLNCLERALFSLNDEALEKYQEIKRCRKAIREAAKISDSTEKSRLLAHNWNEIEKLHKWYKDREKSSENSFERYYDEESGEPLHVWIYRSKCWCMEHHGEYVENVSAKVEGLISCKKVLLNLMYCRLCDCAYMTQESFNAYWNRIGPLNITYDYDDEDDTIKRIGRGYNNLKEKSRLREYGYYVAQDGPNDAERKLILVSLIEHHLFSKEEIINHISWLISANSKKIGFASSVNRWRSDLWFLNNYEIECQKQIYRYLIFENRRRRKKQVSD